MSRILIVEDEEDIALLIATRMKREGHSVTIQPNGLDAISEIKKNKFDLVILDWMLPGTSGLDVIKSINRTIPILMVTAKSEASDIVLGLEFGADDYLTKPFELPVLNARVNALLRRSLNAKSTNPLLQAGGVLLDSERHQATCNGSPLELTKSEFRLLEVLMQNAERVLSREQLLNFVQGDVNVTDRSIDTHIFGLRKKLGTCQHIIETIRGVGYKARGS